MAYDPNDPADKAALEAAVEETTKGLKAKNAELLKKVADAKKGQEIDPVEHQKLVDDLAASTERLTTAEKELAKSNKRAEEQTTRADNLFVDTHLTNALTKVNVGAQFMPAVKAMLSGKVKIATKDGERQALVGDKALGDFVTEWSQGDEGKHFTTAPKSGGGGANGGKADVSTKTLTRSAFEALPHEARATHVKEGGTVTD